MIIDVRRHADPGPRAKYRVKSPLTIGEMRSLRTIDYDTCMCCSDQAQYVSLQ